MNNKAKTLHECLRDLGEAGRELGLAIVYALKIDRLCSWLVKLLDRKSGK